MQNNLVKNTAIYAIGDIIPRILSFISFPILTTYLTPGDYGIINYVNTVNVLLLIISLLGLNTYYLVFYYKEDDEAGQKKLLGNLSIFVFSFNILFSLLLFIIGPLFLRLFGSNIDFFPYMALGIATNFFSVLGVLPLALYRVQERPLPLTILNIIRGFMIFALTLLAVVVFQYSALGVIWVNFIVSFCFGLVFLWITLKNMVWNINTKQLKKALLFSLPLLPGSLAYYLVSMSDRILIDKYLTLTDLGLYSTASTLALLLNIVAYGAYKAFEPYIFKVYGQDNFVEEFIKLRNGFMFVLFLGALCISGFAKEFFEIFSNSQFHIAYKYVPFILVGVLASGINMLFSTVITARGKTKINSMIVMIGGGVSIVKCLFFKFVWYSSSLYYFWGYFFFNFDFINCLFAFTYFLY